MGADEFKFLDKNLVSEIPNNHYSNKLIFWNISIIAIVYITNYLNIVLNKRDSLVLIIAGVLILFRALFLSTKGFFSGSPKPSPEVISKGITKAKQSVLQKFIS